MKIITAMVQPLMLAKVVHALERVAGFPGMTVVDARGFGHRKSRREQKEANVDEFHEKARIEIVARDEMVDGIVEIIVSSAHTGNDGDGKVFVWDVENAVRIQTGETGEAAL
jgi:nitrogen regulatory protein PII